MESAIELPQRAQNHIRETSGYKVLESMIPPEWMIRCVTERDYGVDCYIELVDKQNRLTGEIAFVQMKSTDKIDWRKDNGFKFYEIKKSTTNYLNSFSIPTYLFLVDLSTKEIFFVPVKEYIMEHYEEYTRLRIFPYEFNYNSNFFTAEAFEKSFHRNNQYNQFRNELLYFITNERDYIEFMQEHNYRDCFMQIDPEDMMLFEVVIETILGFLLKSLQSKKGKPMDEIKHYAQLELQMLTTKLLAISVLLKKWGGYNIEKDIALNPIVDPVVLGGLARNIYETLAVFRFVFLLPDDDEKKQIAFNLWERHSFLDSIKELEPTILLNEKKGYDASKLREQLQFDIAQRDQLLAEIQSTTYAKNHTDFDFGKDNAKKSLVIFDDHPKFVSLSGIDREMEYYMPLKNVVFNDLYSILSHYAHPSYQAEYQFDNEFRWEGNNSEGPYHMIVSVAAILSVCFISSYIVYDNAIQNELNDEELEVFNAVYTFFCIGKFGKEPSREEYSQERAMIEMIRTILKSNR